MVADDASAAAAASRIHGRRRYHQFSEV